MSGSDDTGLYEAKKRRAKNPSPFPGVVEELARRPRPRWKLSDGFFRCQFNHQLRSEGVSHPERAAMGAAAQGGMVGLVYREKKKVSGTFLDRERFLTPFLTLF